MTSMMVTAPTRFDELREQNAVKIIGNYENVREREKNMIKTKTFDPWRRSRLSAIINDCSM